VKKGISLLLCLGALAAGATTVHAARDATGLTLPEATGPSPIGRIDPRLVDRSRVDPVAPGHRARELMVHVWYPAKAPRGGRAPYFDARTAALYEQDLHVPAGLLADLRTHAYAGAEPARGRHPVVLLSPGLGVPVALETLLAEDLASHGYAVVAIEQTYEVPVVFPGGRLVMPSGISSEADVSRVLQVRLADARFVLRRLARLPLADAFDLERIAMVGHSLGGATAGSLMLVERRVRAGVNLDGSLRGRVVQEGLDRPFMIALAPGHGSHDLSLIRFDRSQRGPLVRATFAGVSHLGFTDLMALVPQLARYSPAIRREFPVGAADPARAIATQRAYVRAFLDRYLLDRPSPLLEPGARPLPGVALLIRTH